MAERVKMRALRTIQRVGSLVQKGEAFEATADEAKLYDRKKNPLAEPVKSAKADDDAKPAKKSTKK